MGRFNDILGLRSMGDKYEDVPCGVTFILSHIAEEVGQGGVR